MSEQQNVKTEKPTRTYPDARKTPDAFDVPGSIEWIFDVPAGKMLAGFIFDAKVTTVGAGMTAARISQIIKSFKAFADGKLSMDVDQYTLDVLAIASNWSKHHDDYADVDMEGDGSRNVAVQDDVNDPDGAALYGFWKIQAPLPVQNQIRFQLETYSGVTTFGAGMTGGLVNFSIVPVWANVGKRKQYNVYAKQLSNVLRASYRGVEIGCLFTDAEWNTITNSVSLGTPLSVEQTYAIQSDIGNQMTAFGSVGAAVDGRLLTVQDPLPAADSFVLARKFDGQAAVDVNFNSAQTVKTVIFSESNPEQIEVR
jgi:hypothetical protein